MKTILHTAFTAMALTVLPACQSKESKQNAKAQIDALLKGEEIRLDAVPARYQYNNPPAPIKFHVEAENLGYSDQDIERLKSLRIKLPESE